MTKGLNLEAIGVEVDPKGRIVIDSQFNTSVPNVKCIGDVTFGPMLAHKAEEEGESQLWIGRDEIIDAECSSQVSPLSSSFTLATDTSTTRPSPL